MGTRTSNEWDALIAGLPSAPPELVIRRELLRRTDSKFILTPTSAFRLLGALAGEYAVLRNGNGQLASYRTLYFDTPTLDLFHAQRRGFRVRHKVRIRHYEDRRLTTLEVKTRQSELLTSKVWRERPYGDVELRADDQAFVGVRTGIPRPVMPQVWTEFRRMTLLGIETNERITLDLDLRVEDGGHSRSFAGLAIVEVKQWPFSRGTRIMSALRAGGWRPGWVSKYCTAIAFTRPEVRCNELRPGLRALERAAA